MWCFRLGIAAWLTALAAAANAQVVPPPSAWAHGTELAVVTGAASGMSTTGLIAGGTATWDVTRWVGVQGRATWLERGADATGFGADISGLVNLVAKQTVTPFVGAGFGLYRASFGPTAAPPADFYRVRMAPRMIGSTSAFTDPALRVTAGVDVVSQTARRHWTVRPEVSTLVVFANGRNETIVSGTVSVGYRFRGSFRGD